MEAFITRDHRAPRGLLVDFGNTLLGEGTVDALAGTAAVLSHAESPAEHSAEELVEAVRRLDADLGPRRSEAQLELPPYVVDRLVYQPRGIRFNIPDEQVEWTYWDAATSWCPVPGAVEALTFVAEAGVPCGVVSNTVFRGATIARELSRNGFDGLIRWVVASSEHVVRKPHRIIFEVAARRLGVPPEDIWFIGDSLLHDIQGAAAAGMMPIWYRPKAEPPAGDMPEGARVLQDWSDLPSMLRTSSTEATPVARSCTAVRA